MSTAAASASRATAPQEAERTPRPEDGPRYGRSNDAPFVTAVRQTAEPPTEMGMPAMRLAEMHDTQPPAERAAAALDLPGPDSTPEPPPQIKVTRTPVPGTEAAAPVPPAPERPDPEQVASFRQWVRSLGGDDAESRGAAEEKLLDGGAAAVWALMEAFPGRLLVDRYAQEIGAVPVENHSHLLRVLVRMGDPAARALAERASHLSPEARFYAIFAFSAVHAPWALTRLVEGAWDSDASVREITAYVLASYRDDAGFDAAMDALRGALAGDPPRRRRPAAEMLGRLRESRALPELVSALGQQGPGGLAEAAHRALLEIALHDFGHDAWMWEAWYERNRDRPRVEWLLDGLLSDQRPIRLLAFHELRRLTHQNYSYSVDAPPAERRAAVDRWRKWWDTTGHARFGGYRG